MAGHCRSHCFQPVPERRRAVPFGNFVGQVPDQAANVGFTEHGRCFPDRNCAGAEPFEHQSEFGEIPGTFRQPVAIILRQVDDLGQEQDLRCNLAGPQCCFEPLEHQPLMGGVLIDDHQPVTGLRDDVVLVDLRSCRAKRVLDDGRIGFGLVHPR
jgi:hypothetical protein